MEAILEARGVTRHYPMGQEVVRALDGVDLAVASGDFVGLLGTSGSGKSTLLNLIAGLDRPTGGSLEVFGRSLAAMSRDDLTLHRRKNVGMVFQSFNLIPTMTALENVALALVFAGVPSRQRDVRACELLESVGLSGRIGHRPSELSGGEQQRVSIARALANNPEILLADEPTGNLDTRTAGEIMDLIGGVHARDHKTVILVTHDHALAASRARRIVRLSDGKVVADEARP